LRETGPLPGIFTRPLLFQPVFSSRAMIELVIPLAVTVLAVQNAQGFAVLSHAGHRPPINAMTTACGLGSLVLAVIGSVTMCVTGPSNAILASSGEPSRQYIGGITYAVLAIAFGIFGTLMTWLALKLPEAYIAVLGGLAVMKVLEGSFVAAFSGGHTTGALVTLLVTVSDITLLNIGAPFWGLVFGAAVSWLLDRGQRLP
jgi:benzoate membrane transport protein